MRYIYLSTPVLHLKPIENLLKYPHSLILITTVFLSVSAMTLKGNSVSILSMGDSITAGYINGVIDEEKRYTTVLEDSLRLGGYPASIINQGVGGELSTDGASRLADIIDNGDYHAVTILYGANDLLLEYGGEPRVSQYELGEALRFMVQKTREAGAIPVLLSMVPVVPERYYLYHDQELYERYGGITAHWESYDQTVRRIADEERVILTDITVLFGDSLDIALGADGSHPSETGHKIIGVGLYNVIAELIPPTGDDEGSGDPVTLTDCYVFPNPCRLTPGSPLNFHTTVKTSGIIEGRIYDISGRYVARITKRTIDNAGEYTFSWEGRDRQGDPVPPAVYLLSIDWSPRNGDSIVRKIMKFAVLR